MQDYQKINAMLHSNALPLRYKAKPGQFLTIDLPRIPLTRYTEFVRLDKQTFGDVGCFVESEPPDQEEGSLLPRQIAGQARCPGEFHILLRAVDSLSGEEIPNVPPLDIVVQVD